MEKARSAAEDAASAPRRCTAVPGRISETLPAKRSSALRRTPDPTRAAQQHSVSEVPRAFPLAVSSCAMRSTFPAADMSMMRWVFGHRALACPWPATLAVSGIRKRLDALEPRGVQGSRQSTPSPTAPLPTGKRCHDL